MTLAERIAELVEQHGSLRATARVLDCDAGYLSRLQSGEKDNPDDWLLRRMKLRRVVNYERTDAATPADGLEYAVHELLRRCDDADDAGLSTLSTTYVREVLSAIGLKGVAMLERQEDFCGVQQTVAGRETSHGTKYQIASWTCPNCGKPCSCIHVDGEWCHGDALSISFGPEKDADGTWTRHHKCGACWLAAAPSTPENER